MPTVCLTFDFDAVSLWISTFQQTTATPISRGEYGANVGIHRILSVLERRDVKATFFVPAHTAKSFPTEVQRISDEGHEVALHGYCHESPVGASKEEETRLLRASIEDLRNTLGTGYVPRGYRSPAWDLSENSLECLREEGLLYDSSLMGGDFTPYFPRIGYTVDEDKFLTAKGSGIIEFPVAWELDDFPHFHFSPRPRFQGLRPADEVYEIWKSEFDYCQEEVRDGVFTLTMHPAIIGRGPRVRMLDRLITYMQDHSTVRFKTLSDEAGIRMTRS